MLDAKTGETVAQKVIAELMAACESMTAELMTTGYWSGKLTAEMAGSYQTGNYEKVGNRLD